MTSRGSSSTCRALLFLATTCANAATIPLSNTGPLTLNTGEAILVEFAQSQPARWGNLEFLRFTATLTGEVDYSDTLVHIGFESPDGTIVYDTGTHAVARTHFFSQSFGKVTYDFYAGKITVGIYDDLRGLMQGPDMRVRVRMTNYGIPLEFGHAFYNSGPLSFHTFGETGISAGFSQGAGDPKAAWLITSNSAPVPEPSTWMLMSAGVLCCIAGRRRRDLAP
jgi:hypothetical protein